MHHNYRSALSLRRRGWRVVAMSAALFAGVCGVAGCGGSTSAGPVAAASAGSYPVTVTSCGTAETYHSAPRRAVSNDINMTEDMLALGLESRVVGDFGVTGDGPVGEPVPAEYQAGFRKVRDVAS